MPHCFGLAVDHAKRQASLKGREGVAKWCTLSFLESLRTSHRELSLNSIAHPDYKQARHGERGIVIQPKQNDVANVQKRFLVSLGLSVQLSVPLFLSRPDQG